jgi:hypothetical protein
MNSDQLTITMSQLSVEQVEAALLDQLDESMGENEEAMRQAMIAAPPDLTVEPSTCLTQTATRPAEDPTRDYWERLRLLYQNRLSWITVHSGLEYERKYGRPVAVMEITFRSRANFSGEKARADRDQQLLTQKLREEKERSLNSLITFARGRVENVSNDINTIHKEAARRLDPEALKKLELKMVTSVQDEHDKKQKYVDRLHKPETTRQWAPFAKKRKLPQ